MQECIKCGTPQSGFSCSCGARFCGAACQRGHWPDHKEECRAIRKKAEFKVEMDKALRQILEGWDESKDVCFAYYPKAEAVSNGYDIGLASGGALVYFGQDSVTRAIEVRLRGLNHIKCRTWLLELPDMPPRKITSVMINTLERPADEIHKLYAPSLAEPGRFVLHFLSRRKAIAVMGPLMEVD